MKSSKDTLNDLEKIRDQLIEHQQTLKNEIADKQATLRVVTHTLASVTRTIADITKATGGTDDE